MMIMMIYYSFTGLLNSPVIDMKKQREKRNKHTQTRDRTWELLLFRQ